MGSRTSRTFQVRVLITVTTYPLPSRSHGELVCTAGILEDGSWIRIYPVPFSFLEFRKYQWIDLDLVPHDRAKDFRPESHRPAQYDLNDLKELRQLDTRQKWRERKAACLKNVYTNMTSLIADSQEPQNTSLAAFRPTTIKRLIVEEDERQWKPEWLEQLKQVDWLTNPTSGSNQPRAPVDKIPYKFKYKFEDCEGKTSTMTIEDWEIGALYRNCLASSGDEGDAIAKVRQKYEDEFLSAKDITLFLGTTLEHHRRRHPNPFTIIGVFYPPRDSQASLF